MNNEQILNLKANIEQIWVERDNLSTKSPDNIKSFINNAIDALDKGIIRVAEKKDGDYIIHDWVKKSVLLSFYINDNAKVDMHTMSWYDKVASKFKDWSEEDFIKSQVRAVPGVFIRYGAYIAPKVILMPSFVNFGAYIDEGTMIDSCTTIGSCAQIGKNCHISANVCIGGVLEPLQANPTIIGDNCFVGAGSMVLEGMIVEEGVVIASGVAISGSTKIIDKETGEIYTGRIPAYSVVVNGSLPASNSKVEGLQTNVAVIIKKVNEVTRSKTSTTDILRGK